MDPESFEQYELLADMVGEMADFMRDGDEMEIPIWNYVTLAECKPIILNWKNWSLFFEDTFIRPEDIKLAGGKDRKTDWILRLCTIMNKLLK